MSEREKRNETMAAEHTKQEEVREAGNQEEKEPRMEAGEASEPEEVVDDAKILSEETQEETPAEAREAAKAAKKKAKADKKQDKIKEKVEELEDRIKRQMAEFDNFRKRTEKEKTQMFETGAKSVVEKILPVVDNFERGLQTLAGEEENTPFAEGMNMVYKQLMQELEAIGVKPIEALGQEFNPDFHNAVMQVESEEVESGMIAQELQKGYLYHESVIRHSMVAVAQ